MNGVDFAQFAAFDQDGKDNQAFLAKGGKLKMPVLAVGGEKSFGPMMATEKRSELARLLAEVTPGDLTMSFFTNGGSEAHENAIWS